jgi:hypothetical protein
VAAVLGAVFGGLIGVAVAWLAMFSATLGLLDVPRLSLSVPRSAAAGAVFFAVAGALLGENAGTLVGRVIGGIFAFEQLFDRRDPPNPWWLELLLALAGIGVILWAGGLSDLM